MERFLSEYDRGLLMSEDPTRFSDMGVSGPDFLRGMKYTPFDFVGAPVDLLNMGLQGIDAMYGQRNVLGSERPFLGSEDLINRYADLGDLLGVNYDRPTGSGSETLGRVAGGILAPTVGAQTVGRVVDAGADYIAGAPARVADRGFRLNSGIDPAAALDDLIVRGMGDNGGPAMQAPRAAKVASNAADIFSEVKDFPSLTKSEERVVAASSAPPEQVAGLGRVVTEPIDPQNMAASKARFDQLRELTSGYEQERAKARIVRLDDGTDAIQYMEPPATVQSVPISQLKATQPGLLSGGDAPLTEGPPLVVKKGGEFFVRDGHHRLARMIEAGADVADVRVVDLDAGGLLGVDAPRAARVATKMADVPEYPLMVQHNIHEGPLMHSDALGGLPVPSLAVSNPNNPLMTFGDVSLLGPASMATPSAKNPVYSADAYTVRRPKVDSTPNANAEKFVNDEYFKPFGNLLDGDDAASSANAIFTGDDAYGSIPLRAKYMQEKGLLPDIDEAEDYYSFRQKVRNNFVENEDYYDWLGDQRAKMIDAGGEVNQNIFVGYTPSGRAKTKPATLENMVKQMAKEGAGAEGFSGGIAGTRAKVAPKFKTAADVRAARRRVVSPSRFEVDKEDLQEIYDPFNAKIRNAVVEKSGLQPYEAHRAAEELVEDLILGDWGKYEYHNQYKGIVDESVLAEAKKIKNEMQNMGTEYFEAKPKRAVSLSEFQGAIVPHNATKETLRILDDAGIKKVYKYKNEDERKSLYKKFPELMFSVGGLGLLGASQIDKEPQPKGIMF